MTVSDLVPTTEEGTARKFRRGSAKWTDRLSQTRFSVVIQYNKTCHGTDASRFHVYHPSNNVTLRLECSCLLDGHALGHYALFIRWLSAPHTLQ